MPRFWRCGHGGSERASRSCSLHHEHDHFSAVRCMQRRSPASLTHSDTSETVSPPIVNTYVKPPWTPCLSSARFVTKIRWGGNWSLGGIPCMISMIPRQFLPSLLFSHTSRLPFLYRRIWCSATTVLGRNALGKLFGPEQPQVSLIGTCFDLLQVSTGGKHNESYTLQ